MTEYLEGPYALPFNKNVATNTTIDIKSMDKYPNSSKFVSVAVVFGKCRCGVLE